MEKGKEQDRLSILEKIERGEISVEEAEVVLERAPEEPEAVEARHDVSLREEKVEEVTEEEPEEGYVATRRERKIALAEKFQDWQPEMMVGLEGGGGPWQWPWKDKTWQWMWQNFGHPVYISHSIDATEGSELKVVSYQGDLFILGWDEPTLKINGAVFDIRIGQDENVIRIASSTGQLQIWVPASIARVETKVKPGDIWLSGISADIDIYCQSGDLGCEQIKGNVRGHVNGGDARLMGIEGSLDVEVIRGNSEIRGISSTDVTLKATEGDIWLNLDSVSSGRFRCENNKGDINLLTRGELSCELLVQATEGGRIAPMTLPWQRLLERSEGKLHGILKGGGASVSLITRGGKIYIQESWMNTFPMSSPS
jgi:hypothetical protein